MSIQILGKQERKVECFWGGFPCKKGHTVEEQNFCEHGGTEGILKQFCQPPEFAPSTVICKSKAKSQTIGYQKIGDKGLTKKEICIAVEVCNDDGNDPAWTDEVHHGDWTYKFCQSDQNDKIGIIYEMEENVSNNEDEFV